MVRCFLGTENLMPLLLLAFPLPFMTAYEACFFFYFLGRNDFDYLRFLAFQDGALLRDETRRDGPGQTKDTGIDTCFRHLSFPPDWYRTGLDRDWHRMGHLAVIP